MLPFLELGRWTEKMTNLDLEAALRQGVFWELLEWIGGNMKQEMLQIPLTSLRTFQKGGSALLESLFVSMWWDLLHQRQSLSALGAIGLLQWPAFYAFYHVRQICRSGVRGALSSPGH